jgi:hypothetical protein
MIDRGACHTARLVRLNYSPAREISARTPE